VLPGHTKLSDFREQNKKIFEYILVIYSENFRTRKVLGGLRDIGEDSFADECLLYAAFRRAWGTREKFCTLLPVTMFHGVSSRMLD